MRSLLALPTLILASCALGPDYQRPSTEVQARFDQLNHGYLQAEPVAEFWRGFDEPQLTSLVEGALAANHDLKAALARLDRARALARLSRKDLWPTVTAGAGYTETRLSSDQAPGLDRAQRDTELYTASFDAFWELDLFGRVRRGTEAARADAAAAASDFHALQVSVAAEAARSYFELRGLQLQLQVARENADNQEATLELTIVRRDAGRGTDLDVSRARGQFEFTRSRIPALESAVISTAHRLAVLNGEQPGAFVLEPERPARLPALPESVAVGTPEELLRRRPDIAAAERRLHSATARVGVATADLFPRVSLSGFLGSAAVDLGDLFESDSENYAYGASVGWAFLDLGRVRARIEASEAGAAESLALYEGTVLRALEEAENALVAYSRARRENDHLRDSARASVEAARLARLRFEAGATDFLQVLDAERSLLDAQDRHAQSHTRVATALVAVYKAVAGGWPERLPEIVQQ
jgi:multidrug efflux system outer membrane protein